MPKYKNIEVPKTGKRITVKNKKLVVPAKPIIPFIEGDGIGRDITKATVRVVDAAVEKAFKGKKKISWMEVYAGEKANDIYKEWLPKETVDAIKHYYVAIKGPLTTPIGGGFRSLNVSLRQLMNLYACVRPVNYFKGVGSPVVHPEKLDVVIYRENTEDVYSGIEWKKGTKDCKKVITWLNKNMKTTIRSDSGIGVKPISVTGSKRLARKAIQFAIDNKRRSVTFVHKGNIMKFTEGAFKDWGYELAIKEFRNKIVTEDELWGKYKGKMPKNKILINDRIADSIFQQVLTRPDEYDVLATPNLNGDYLSDACAAQVGGLGMAPGANMGDYIGLFEATHGTAPKYADKDVINPSSLILSAAMMLDYLGWGKAGDMIRKTMQKTIDKKTVTYDLHRQMKGAKKVGTTAFADQLIKNMR
ncbi:MAG TPA: isocitrate dehydrogenase (NADP(+)) [candidate division Zixibacteria bacterium]|nr:isocitrate dehydrogenase (NADP(+)) [candidate division Zixibacteria bacterium]